MLPLSVANVRPGTFAFAMKEGKVGYDFPFFLTQFDECCFYSHLFPTSKKDSFPLRKVCVEL
jgi:hypothetical protein